MLRDKTWSIASFETSDGRVLTNATFRVINVHYDVRARKAEVFIEFKENTFPVVRSFHYEVPDDSTEQIAAEHIEVFVATVFPSAVLLEESN